MLSSKSKLYYGQYLTRKDWYHFQPEYFMSFYSKKYWRKVANKKLRKTHRLKEISNGGSYKKIIEVQWIVI